MPSVTKLVSERQVQPIFGPKVVYILALRVAYEAYTLLRNSFLRGM